MKLKRLGQSFKTKEVDRDNYRIRFVMSSADVDRHGDVIDQNGWRLESFKENPVVLWGHNQSIPAIGKILPETLGVVNNQLEGVVQFAYNESALAREIFELCAGGYINACSVGFRNHKWQYDENEDIFTLLENELYELSVVNVPANQRALAHNKGIETPVLDGFDEIATKAEDSMKRIAGHRKDDLGEEVKPEAQEEKPEEKPEETEEETPETSGDTPNDETPVQPTEEEVKSALVVLFGADNETVRACVKEIADRLNQAQADTKGSEVEATAVGKKKTSAKHINRLIRNLLNSK